MLSRPHRFLFFCFVVSCFPSPSLFAQKLEVYGGLILAIADERVAADHDHLLNPAIAELLQSSSNELKLMHALIRERINSKENEDRVYEIINDFCRQLKVIDPEFYARTRELSLVQQIKSNSSSNDDAKLLLFYNIDYLRESLRITASQGRELDKSVEQFQSHMEKLRILHENEMRFALAEYVELVKKSLTPAQLEVHARVYGVPMILETSYVFLRPSGFANRHHTDYNDEILFEISDLNDEDHLRRLDLEGIEIATSTPESILATDSIDWDLIGVLFLDCLELNTATQLKIKEAFVAERLRFSHIVPGTVPRLQQLASPDFAYPAELQKILSKKQLQRLAQLEFQVRDSNILDLGLFSEAVAELKLSEKQVEEIRQKQAEVLESIGKEYEKYQTAMEAPLTEAYERCEKVLDEKQLEAVTLKMDRKEFITRLVGKKIEAPAKQTATDEK